MHELTESNDNPEILYAAWLDEDGYYYFVVDKQLIPLIVKKQREITIPDYCYLG
jgi:hypothetical protein